jgi:hypothetical protein
MPRNPPKLPVFDLTELEIIEIALANSASKFETIADSYDEPERSRYHGYATAMDKLLKKVSKPLRFARDQAEAKELADKLAQVRGRLGRRK